MALPVNTILQGDALTVLKTVPDESVNCCISSPPYWSLRDYGVAGQLGLEPTFEEYIDKLCTIYDEVKRVLRKDGTCFVNLGDTYSSKGTGKAQSNTKASNGEACDGFRSSKYLNQERIDTTSIAPEKSLCLIPQRFAIQMVNRGWILRNKIVWHKPNPMPSSAKDRFTVDYEVVWFLVKQKRYFFEPQYEPYLTESNAERPRMGQGTQTKYQSKRGFEGKWADTDKQSSGQRMQTNLIKQRKLSGEHDPKFNPLGRNKRCVWTIPTQAYSEAHFATFPEKLVEPMIKAGCPEFVCKKCGQPRRKIYDIQYKSEADYSQTERAKAACSQTVKVKRFGDGIEAYFKGYTDCGCANPQYRPGIVLDPFLGSGTTAQVAAYLRRDWVGIDLKYINMATRRIAQGETAITPREQTAGQLALFPPESRPQHAV